MEKELIQVDFVHVGAGTVAASTEEWHSLLEKLGDDPYRVAIISGAAAEVFVERLPDRLKYQRFQVNKHSDILSAPSTNPLQEWEDIWKLVEDLLSEFGRNPDLRVVIASDDPFLLNRIGTLCTGVTEEELTSEKGRYGVSVWCDHTGIGTQFAPL